MAKQAHWNQHLLGELRAKWLFWQNEMVAHLWDVFLASLPLKFLIMLYRDAGIQPGGLEVFSLLWLFIVFTAILENFYVKECIFKQKKFL